MAYAYIICKKRAESPHDNVFLHAYEVNLSRFKLERVLEILHKNGMVCIKNFSDTIPGTARELGLQFQKEYLLDLAKKYASLLEASPNLEILTKRNFLVTFDDPGNVIQFGPNRFWFLYASDYKCLRSLGVRVAKSGEVAAIKHANRVLFTHDASKFDTLKKKESSLPILRVLRAKIGLPHTPTVDTLIFDCLYLWDMICKATFEMVHSDKSQQGKKRSDIIDMFINSPILLGRLQILHSLIQQYSEEFEFELKPIPDIFINRKIEPLIDEDVDTIRITQEDIIV